MKFCDSVASKVFRLDNLERLVFMLCAGQAFGTCILKNGNPRFMLGKVSVTEYCNCNCVLFQLNIHLNGL